MKKSQSRKPKIAVGILNFLLWFAGTVILILVAFFVLLYYIHKGPSPRFRDLFVSSAKESSVGGVLVDLYLTPDEVDKIMAKNSTKGLMKLQIPI